MWCDMDPQKTFQKNSFANTNVTLNIARFAAVEFIGWFQ